MPIDYPFMQHPHFHEDKSCLPDLPTHPHIPSHISNIMDSYNSLILLDSPARNSYTNTLYTPSPLGCHNSTSSLLALRSTLRYTSDTYSYIPPSDRPIS